MKSEGVTVGWSKVRDGGGVAYRTGSDKVRVCTPQVLAVISLGCFRGCCNPIRMMACKADLYSIVITKQLYTCKYTAIDCAIVTLAEDRGWIRV